jgi:hypothetical protein
MSNFGFLKEVTAQTYIEVLCTCPYCDCGGDIFDQVKESMNGEPSAYGIDAHIVCTECNETFIVNTINF